jgi:DNA-binding MarR family transcriptional regulator
MTESRPSAPPPPAFPAVFLNHLGFVVNRVAEKLNAQVEQVILPHGLSVGHYGLLLLLQAEGPQAQIVLSQRIGLDRTTVMRTVDGLEARGLARRDPHPTDRRKYSVALTDTGAAFLAQTLPDIRDAEGEVTDVLSEVEQAQLLSLLRRLLEPGVTP